VLTLSLYLEGVNLHELPTKSCQLMPEDEQVEVQVGLDSVNLVR
jgi:hypothetical protein